MNRKDVLAQFKELKYNFENFTNIETTESDVQAFDYAIKELGKESDKCNCCNENSYMITVDSIKLCKDCLNRLKEINL